MSNAHESLDLVMTIPCQSKFFRQWVDVHIPGLSQPGGFTITSPPRDALIQPPHEDPTSSSSLSYPSIELAIQYSPQNPAAAWFWQVKPRIINSEVQVRVGGRFVWPPPTIPTPAADSKITTLVLVAGGVGINPLISILSHLSITKSLPSTVRFLYSSKLPRRGSSSSNLKPEPEEEKEEEEDILAEKEEDGNILFLARLKSLLLSAADTTAININENIHVSSRRLDLFLTGDNNNNDNNIVLSAPESQSQSFLTQSTGQSNTDPTMHVHHRRITPEDLIEALSFPPGEQIGSGTTGRDRDTTVCYVCGPSRMTDWIVGFLKDQLPPPPPPRGEERVLCERWW
ncbi:MAG: hypothetical protein M1816_008116 [Peltula sp. TS41687]|nr:MAG: hypothetical protein M1816_008116 [Peltula sp. TS41687]